MKRLALLMTALALSSILVPKEAEARCMVCECKTQNVRKCRGGGDSKGFDCREVCEPYGGLSERSDTGGAGDGEDELDTDSGGGGSSRPPLDEDDPVCKKYPDLEECKPK